MTALAYRAIRVVPCQATLASEEYDSEPSKILILWSRISPFTIRMSFTNLRYATRTTRAKRGGRSLNYGVQVRPQVFIHDRWPTLDGDCRSIKLRNSEAGKPLTTNT